MPLQFIPYKNRTLNIVFIVKILRLTKGLKQLDIKTVKSIMKHLTENEIKVMVDHEKQMINEKIMQ